MPTLSHRIEFDYTAPKLCFEEDPTCEMIIADVSLGHQKWHPDRGVRLIPYMLMPEAQQATRVLQLLSQRLRSTRTASREDDLRQYAVPLSEAFRMASAEYSSISINENTMAGAPCVANTRIPVYMVLDAVEGYVDVKAVRESYPTLTVEQIREAIGFAKLVVECTFEHKAATSSR